MTLTITFYVFGRPAPQGSKRLLNRKTGAMGESSKRVAPWRSDVRAVAMLQRDKFNMRDRPVRLECVFKFRRPASHYSRRGGCLILKPSAPQYCTTRIGDVDKLLRAISDALAGVLYDDDAQIVDIAARREYAGFDEMEHAAITVTGY